MAITYKSVIAEAISHFNDVQTKLSEVGASYKFDGSTLEPIPTVTTNAKLVPTVDLGTIIKDQLQLKATGTYQVTSAGTFSLINGKSSYANVSVAKGSLSGGSLTGGGDVGIDIYELPSGSQDQNVGLDLVDIGTKDTTNYPYYFKIGAKGTSKTVELGNVTVSPGWIDTTSNIAGGSKTISANEVIEYVKLKKANFTGDSFSAGSFNVSLTNGNNIAFISKPSAGSDGVDYYSVTASGTGVANSASHSVSVSGGFTTGLSDSHQGTPSSNGNVTKYIAKAAFGEITTSGTLSGYGVTTAGYRATGKILDLAVLSVSGSAAATISVDPGAITISKTTKAVSGKTIVSVDPTTDSTKISKYYIPISAKAAANTTGTTTEISGSVNASTNTSGYAKSGTTSATGSITGSATATTNEKTSSDYYMPLPSAAATISTTTQAVAPTVANDESNDNIIVSGSATTAKPSSGFYAAVKATAPATSLTVSKTVGTAGWLGTNAQISGMLSTTAKTGSTYYIPIQSGSVADPVPTVGISDNICDAEECGGTMLLTEAPTTARKSFTCTTARKGIRGVSEYYSSASPSDTTIIYEPYLVAGTTYYYEPYFTIVANASATKSISKDGYLDTSFIPTIHSNSKKYYMPIAEFKYTTDASGGKFIQVSTSGYVPSGIIDVISGTIDKAELSLNIVGAVQSDGSYLLTVSKGDCNPGYMSASDGTLKNNTISLAKATYTGGGLTGAGDVGIDIVKVARNTTETTIGETAYTNITITDAKPSSGKYFKVSAFGSSKTITRAAITASNDGYSKNGTNVLSSGTATVTAATKSEYISLPEGTVNLTGGGITGSATITTNSTSPTKTGGNAIVNNSTTGEYVVVNATASANRSDITFSSAIDGWVTKTNGSTALTGASNVAITSGKAHIPAAVNPSVTTGTPSASISAATVGTATTFNESGILTAGSKSTGSLTGNISAITVLSAQYKDKYIVGGITAKTNSGTATFAGATIADDATGDEVDNYLAQLYKRMNGKAYTAVSAD